MQIVVLTLYKMITLLRFFALLTELKSHIKFNHSVSTRKEQALKCF